MLPNAVIDGYQTHICAEVEKHRDLTNNWLTNIHHQQIKKLVMEKQIKKVVKRKRSTSISPCNNLTKYFKRSNKNFKEIDVK